MGIGIIQIRKITIARDNIAKRVSRSALRKHSRTECILDLSNEYLVQFGRTVLILELKSTESGVETDVRGSEALIRSSMVIGVVEIVFPEGKNEIKITL